VNVIDVRLWRFGEEVGVLSDAGHGSGEEMEWWWFAWMLDCMIVSD
jgi:hypothetical protein